MFHRNAWLLSCKEYIFSAAVIGFVHFWRNTRSKYKVTIKEIDTFNVM